MIILKLFISFLQIGVFSFGGGYAAMPLIQAQVVDKNSWITLGEFTDLITISQMTPGPIAVNAATFIGIRTAGIGGAVAATLGCILPSCIIVSVISALYMKYRSMRVLDGALDFLRPAVIALIAYSGLSILISAAFADGVKADMLIIFTAALLPLRKSKLDPIIIIFISGGMKLILFLVKQHIF